MPAIRLRPHYVQNEFEEYRNCGRLEMAVMGLIIPSLNHWVS
ncbi:MAG: hypothetical protein ACI9V8_000540 [Urechidicola sp.]|jgi:hypothetical protein